MIVLSEIGVNIAPLLAGAGALGLACAYEAVRSGTCLPTAGLRADPPQPASSHTPQEIAA